LREGLKLPDSFAVGLKERREGVDWRKLHSKDHHDLYSLAAVVNVLKSNRCYGALNMWPEFRKHKMH
jgi:hypothetical protein